MSTWNSPEHRAVEDAQMELNIAADRWHDFPDDKAVAAELCKAIEVYRTARDAWVRLVAGPAAVDPVGESAGATPVPADPPANCPACGHPHATDGMAGICIGCPCNGGQG